MSIGFVTDKDNNKSLWGILSLIFLISHGLLHFLDSFTRNHLSNLPLSLLNAARPLTLVKVYYIGFIIDIICLISTLLLSFFQCFNDDINTFLYYILVCSSLYDTNELRTYFVRSIEDVAACHDPECFYNNNINKQKKSNDDTILMMNKNPKLYNKSILSSNNYNESSNNIENDRSTMLSYNVNKYIRRKGFILSKNNIHYHYNPERHTLTSLDGIKSWTIWLLIIYFNWFMIIIENIAQNDGFSFRYDKDNPSYYFGYIILFLNTILYFIRISSLIYALSRSQPKRKTKNKQIKINPNEYKKSKEINV